MLEWILYIRGYHAYSKVWGAPVSGEILLLKREPTNSKDKHAVAVYKDDVTVGHVPYNISASLSAFLRRDLNKAFAEVTGGKVNSGAGYGWEKPGSIIEY